MPNCFDLKLSNNASSFLRSCSIKGVIYAAKVDEVNHAQLCSEEQSLCSIFCVSYLPVLLLLRNMVQK